MAKRYTDSTKWNDNWFFNLKNEEKLAWLYILDTCDHAGVWEKNLRILNFQIGTSFVEDDLKKVFEGKFIEIKNKWFIPNFIKFQYGKTFLSSSTPAVKSARDLLLDYGFIKTDENGNLQLIIHQPNPSITLTQPLHKGYLTVKDKDKDMDMVMCKVMDEDTDEVMDMFKHTDKDEDTDEDTDEVQSEGINWCRERLNKQNK
jgi:hypothetical protein